MKHQIIIMDYYYERGQTRDMADRQRLGVVIPVMNQFPLLYAVLKELIDNRDPASKLSILLIDNGSSVPLGTNTEVLKKMYPDYDSSTPIGITLNIIRNEESTGVYPTFWQGMYFFDRLNPSIRPYTVAFFHSDLVIWEKNWDSRIIKDFNTYGLAMAGFIGSNEIDSAGGRGLGTSSQFMGMTLSSRDEDGRVGGIWHGSEAKIHGRVITETERAVVVDGCAMIFNVDWFHSIQIKENFPPHHFYDKLLSTQIYEAGGRIAIIPIQCDHISGQTVNQEPLYFDMARKWAEAHNVPFKENWDHTIYLESEKQWLTEYRDQKKIIPAQVSRQL